MDLAFVLMSYNVRLLKMPIYLSDIIFWNKILLRVVVVQFRAIVCTVAIAYFLCFLYFNIYIKHIFVASCYRYLIKEKAIER